MLFLVEVDHVESGNVSSPDAGRGSSSRSFFRRSRGSTSSSRTRRSWVAGPLLDALPCDWPPYGP